MSTINLNLKKSSVQADDTAEIAPIPLPAQISRSIYGPKTKPDLNTAIHCGLFYWNTLNIFVNFFLCFPYQVRHIVLTRPNGSEDYISDKVKVYLHEGAIYPQFTVSISIRNIPCIYWTDH